MKKYNKKKLFLRPGGDKAGGLYSPSVCSLSQFLHPQPHLVNSNRNRTGLLRKPFPPPQELKDPQCRDEMAAARGALKKNATMLYTASQAFLRHPDVAATRANRDYVFKQVQEAIGGISSAAQATSPTDEKHGHAGIGELAAALNEFDVSLQTFSFLFHQLRPV